MELEDYLTLLALAGIWGASFLFIKVAVGEMPPVFLVFGRTLAATVGLIPVLYFSRISLRQVAAHWRPGLVIAVLNSAAPYTLIAFGEQFIDSSLAGILNATAPLWTALLAPLWVEAEGLRRRQVAGLALGFAGVVVLAHPTGNVFTSNSLGILAVVVATFSYGFATHFSKRHFQTTPPQVPAFLQVALSVVLLGPLILISHPTRVPSLAATAAVLWLGLGATGLAMVMAYRLIKRVGATRTIVVTYLIPPAALFWGVFILHEHPGPGVLLALALILSGVFLNTRSGPPRLSRLGIDEAVVEV